MRLAILSDIHGNVHAFEAALKHVAAQRVDQVVISGDIVIGSPDSKACLELALSTGCPILRGNHERYIAHYGTPQAAPEWSSEQFAPLRLAWEQFSADQRALLGNLPTSLRLPDAPGVYLVHATERSDHESVQAHTPEEKLSAMFPTAQERYIVRSHNHHGQVRLWQRGYIITNGSVGLPLDGNPTAQYLILEQNNNGWKILHQSVPYDLDAAIRRFHENDYLASAGPIGRLYFREMITAAQQIVPFFRLFAQWNRQEPLSLAQGVERYLSL